MHINKILGELRAQRAQLDEAIMAMQRMQYGGGKRRGRPPKWLTGTKEASTDAPKRRGRPPKSHSSS